MMYFKGGSEYLCNISHDQKHMICYGWCFKLGLFFDKYQLDLQNLSLKLSFQPLIKASFFIRAGNDCLKSGTNEHQEMGLFDSLSGFIAAAFGFVCLWIFQPSVLFSAGEIQLVRSLYIYIVKLLSNQPIKSALTSFTDEVDLSFICPVI